MICHTARRRKPKPPTREQNFERVVKIMVARGMTYVEIREVTIVIGLQTFKQGIGIGWTQAENIVRPLFGMEPYVPENPAP